MTRYKIGPIGLVFWIIIIIAALFGQQFVDALKGLFIIGIGAGVLVFIGIAFYQWKCKK
jgi:galactitol-specific phosphotransferase system IIC component